MDNALVEYVLEEFKKESRLDIRNDSAPMMRVREAS